MSQIDLSTHSAAINDALNKVRNNQGIDWFLLSFEGKTNSLHVAETGKGLDDLEEAFNDGKIEFAYTKVIDENSQLPKFVFISWCGEGVPENKKGLLQLHTQAVEKLLKGFHVHINARSTKDVDKATISKKVRDSSGANYSFHKEVAKPAAPEKPQAVGSSYQKPEIMGRSKDVTPASFTKPADDGAERRRIEEERKKQEEQERKRVQDEERERNAAAQQQQQQQQQVEQRRKAEEEQRRKAEEEQRRKAEEEQRRMREDEERKRKQAEKDAAAAAAAAPQTSGGLTATAAYDYEANDANELPFQAGELITGIEKIDDGWWQGYNSQGAFGMFPANYVVANEDAPAHAGSSEPVPEPVAAAPEASNDGSSAVAIYDYAASDDSELSFAVGELITEIVAIDENWWQGKNASGYHGMFPSSYVQSN